MQFNSRAEETSKGTNTNSKDESNMKDTFKINMLEIYKFEKQVKYLEQRSTNGNLVWKISGVSERIKEAKTGNKTSFCSVPFYTSNNGYKMCARIYLNGCRSVRDKYISLSFIIMKGDHDQLLKWPFKQKVTFMLLDQSPSEMQQNLIEVFQPKAKAFKRPQSEMNVHMCIQKFCSLATLQSPQREYIKDDIMFIKIDVDCKNLQEI